jgi:DNA-binding NarL/FixJ family response regulator
MATTLLIADDHLPSLGLLQMILEDSGFEVVAAARTGREAVDLAAVTEPHVCLLDLRMPDGDGVEAASKITRRSPGTLCVLLTSSDSEEDLLAALRAGAVGVLAKDMDLDRLPDALRGVLRGEAALPRVQMTRVIEELRVMQSPEGPRVRVLDLTDEEWTVVKDMRERATAAVDANF